MMRNIFFFILLLPITICGQDSKSLYKENNISLLVIMASPCENGKPLMTLKHEIKIDRHGNSQSTKTYNPDGSLKSEIENDYSDDGLTKTFQGNDKDGNVSYTSTIITDPVRNTVTNFQLDAKNDTVVWQKRYLNQKGKDSILFNKKNEKIYVSMQWQYNNAGEMIKSESFDEKGNLIKSRNIKFETDGNCILYYDDQGIKDFRKCKEHLTETQYFLNASQKNVSNFGIPLKIVQNGKCVTSYHENGLEKSRIYYDAKGEKLSEILFEYTTY